MPNRRSPHDPDALPRSHVPRSLISTSTETNPDQSTPKSRSIHNEGLTDSSSNPSPAVVERSRGADGVTNGGSNAIDTPNRYRTMPTTYRSGSTSSFPLLSPSVTQRADASTSHAHQCRQDVQLEADKKKVPVLGDELISHHDVVAQSSSKRPTEVTIYQEETYRYVVGRPNVSGPSTSSNYYGQIVNNVNTGPTPSTAIPLLSPFVTQRSSTSVQFRQDSIHSRPIPTPRQRTVANMQSSPGQVTVEERSLREEWNAVADEKRRIEAEKADMDQERSDIIRTKDTFAFERSKLAAQKRDLEKALKRFADEREEFEKKKHLLGRVRKEDFKEKEQQLNVVFSEEKRQIEERFHNQFDALKDKLAKKQKELEDLQTLRMNHENMEKNIAEMKDKLAKKQKELEDLQTLRMNHENMEKNIAEMKDKLAKKEKELEDLQTLRMNHENMEKNIAEMKADSEGQRRTLDEKFRSLAQERRQTEEQYIRRNNDLKGSLREKEQELMSLREQKNFEETTRETTIEELKGEMQTFKEQVDHLTEALKICKKQWEKERVKVKSLEEELKKLESTVAMENTVTMDIRKRKQSEGAVQADDHLQKRSRHNALLEPRLPLPSEIDGRESGEVSPNPCEISIPGSESVPDIFDISFLKRRQHGLPPDPTTAPNEVSNGNLSESVKDDDFPLRRRVDRHPPSASAPPLEFSNVGVNRSEWMQDNDFPLRRPVDCLPPTAPPLERIVNRTEGVPTVPFAVVAEPMEPASKTVKRPYLRMGSDNMGRRFLLELIRQYPSVYKPQGYSDEELKRNMAQVVKKYGSSQFYLSLNGTRDFDETDVLHQMGYFKIAARAYQRCRMDHREYDGNYGFEFARDAVFILLTNHQNAFFRKPSHLGYFDSDCENHVEEQK